MNALLLAAGMGQRLRPITDTIPKCLVPIHGRPLLDYWLDILFETRAVDHAVINTHYLADKVDEFLARSRWRNRITTVFEPELLGTGGTVVANQAFFRGAPFLLAHADNLTDIDIRAFEKAHNERPEGVAITMLAFRSDDPRSCGILEVDDQWVVKAFHEKVDSPPGNLANAAVYILEPEVTKYAAALGGPFVDFSTQIIPHFVGRIFAIEHRGYHRDIGNPESLAHAQANYPRPG
jgi:mannose-1-phosphate guanylyltransferase